MPTDFPPSPMFERERLMRRAGNSVMFFCGVMLLGSAALAMLWDTMTLDLTAVLLFFLGRRTVTGSRPAAGWATLVAIFYLATAVALGIAALIAPHQIRVGGHVMQPDELPGCLAMVAVVAIWSAVNIGMLLRARQSEVEP